MIMPLVIRPFRRVAALLLTLPFLAFASAIAPEHVHQPGPRHDHDRAIGHSHFAPHQFGLHQSVDTEIEHDIEHGEIVWLNSPILNESSHDSEEVLPSIPVSYDVVLIEPAWSVTPVDTAAPAHGPPKPVQRFRGPPSASRRT
jgi:hypothetical protein